MTPELGQIHRPDAGDVLGKRKAYVALLVPPSPNAPEGYEERYQAYWKSLDRHISSLEAKAGPVKHIFVEGVSRSGQAGLNMLEKSNPVAAGLATARLKGGAVFEQFEDEALFGEVLDWGRCLQLGFVSRKVAETVHAAFRNASAERQKQLLQRIDSAVKPGEAALVLGARNDSVPLPAGMERFLVSPPELDELERWVRQANEAVMRELEAEERRMAEEEAHLAGAPGHEGHNHGPLPHPAQAQPAARPVAAPVGQTPPPPPKPGGLWTPGQR
jgi:hypothetical protein